MGTGKQKHEEKMGNLLVKNELTFVTLNQDFVYEFF